MIFGLGTDIVAVSRMSDLFKRHGERLAARLLTQYEREDYLNARDPARFLAKRFAAKEAFGKAMGLGLRGIATLRNIGVAHDALGKPVYRCAEPLADHLARNSLVAHLSLSDERDYVVAVAILERS